MLLIYRTTFWFLLMLLISRELIYRIAEATEAHFLTQESTLTHRFQVHVAQTFNSS